MVAPMRIMLPFSTNGRKASCWALLKRWISSTKSTVRCPILLASSAWFMTSRISLIPLVTALKLINWAFVLPAIMLARVVFPTPGGPQKIMEEIWSFSISCRRIFPFPSRCSWPAKSSRESGRSLVARGADCPLSSNNDICSISYTSLFPYPDERFSFLEAGESCLLL